MTSLEKLPNHWDRKNRECKVIVDTPKGRRNKFRNEPDFQLFGLSHTLAAGLVFPFDFGFIPSTLGEDGDPLDVMILMEEPAHVGCLLDVRLIGIIQANQTQEGRTFANDRLIGISPHSRAHRKLTAIDQVDPTLLDQIEQFFITYNLERNRIFKVKRRHGPDMAARAVEAGIKAFGRH